MNQLILKIFKTIPIATLLYSFWFLYVCLDILHDREQNYFFFLFLSFQVYINWITVVCVSSNCTNNIVQSFMSEDNKESITLDLLHNEIKPWEDNSSLNYNSLNKNEQSLTKIQKKNENSSIEDDFNIDSNTVWYCPKCCQRSSQNCFHCPICNKCVIERDHHCFFLGSCITRQNLKHFVVLLFYTCVSSAYGVYLVCIEMDLFNSVANEWTLIFQHFLPVAFALFLGQKMIFYNVLQVALLNTGACLSFFSFGFFIYNIYLIVSGRMLWRMQKRGALQNKSYVSRSVWTNFSLIFGKCGLMNFLMPVGFARNVLKIHLQ